MVWVTGGIVLEVDRGMVYTMLVVTDCVSGAGVGERMLLVGDVITLGLTGEDMLGCSESHTPVRATEEEVGGIMVISVRGDSAGRSVVGFSVVFPVDVTPRLGKGG